MKDKLNKIFVSNLEKIYSKNDLEIIEKGFSCKKRKTSFRVNTLKSTNEEIEKVLKEKGLEFKKIDFLPNAYILENGTEKDLWDLDIFTKGKIYLQSISSQIPVALLNIKEGDKILDITASPGGKTTQAGAVLKNTGKIIAVDNNAIRIDKLNFTIKRQGLRNVEVIKTDARNLVNNNDYIGYFDKIIADLPCSAEGKFNYNIEKTYGYWNESTNKKNYRLQKDIMKSIIPLLKDSGELVYSTCTISPIENEDVVHMILSNYENMYLEDINLDYEYSKDGVIGFDNKVYKKDMKNTKRILPSEESEGFFVALFKKK